MKYARKCDITGKGMNKGWVVGPTEMYIADEEKLIEHLRAVDWEYCEGVKSTDIADSDDLIEYFYNESYLYYTEWDESEIEEQGYYYTEEGEEIVL